MKTTMYFLINEPYDRRVMASKCRSKRRGVIFDRGWRRYQSCLRDQSFVFNVFLFSLYSL